MTDRPRLGALGRRLLAGFLAVAAAALGVLLVGTVLPHLDARSGHVEAVEIEWLLAATGVAVLTAVAVSVVVSHRMVVPMEVILDATRAFAAGDHSARVPDLRRAELAELVDTLNAAASEVERSEQARQRLTADIAHELRTPLTALQAGLEELRDGLVPPTPATLAALHDQASRLGRVVVDLAELSAVESGGLPLVLGRVDLGTVAQEALSTRWGAMSAAGLGARAVVEPSVFVVADGDRLHQVLGNLLANSTAYCRPGDTVEVCVRTEDGHGVLQVSDTGPGLAHDERTHAFDRRWRGRGARGTSGSGLGLPIVQALVLAQGGRVELTSAEGAGTVVRVMLPLAR